ncbi:MAG TPA: sulfatase [Chloroflexia bacterium]|nr:sulfatase [Chloroflexia bacterium]
MNIILVLIDSLNRHFLSAYAPSEVATPNLDAFARRAWRFDNHFVGSLPCMPARREIFAGFKEVMWRPWGSLEPFDRRLPRVLQAQGYRTAICTDHYHYWEEQANGYIQSFENTRLIRGHETDNWKGPVRDDEPVPKWVENIERWRPTQARTYYGNVKDFQGEEDYFPARLMTAASQWLEENRGTTPFYLQVESFDVHEPFDVPEPYASMYGDGSLRDRYTLWPPYQDPEVLAHFMAETTPEELAFIRAQYSGKLTMVDRWFGEVLKKLDELDLWNDTAVIVTTDHGHDLGERGAFGKQYPHYDSHANIPLLAWHPSYPGNGRAISRLTSTVDLFPTVLQLAGAPDAGQPHGRSLLPLIESEGRADGREALLYGTFGQGVCATDGQWTIFKSPAQDGPLYSYSAAIYRSQDVQSAVPPAQSGNYIPGAALPQWQVPLAIPPLSREHFLFNRADDPGQAHNLWDSEPRQRERMLGVLRDLLASEGTPPEQYERLGLD